MITKKQLKTAPSYQMLLWFKIVARGDKYDSRKKDESLEVI